VGEDGVDEGGPRKEFFQLIIKEVFDVKYGMFSYNKNTNVFWFDDKSIEYNSTFQLIGKLLGIAIYNGIILDIHFPMIVYKKLVGIEPSFDDLYDFDPDLAKSFINLSNYEYNFDELELFFQIDIDVFGKKETVDLVKNGGEKKVTKENLHEYIDAYVKYLLVDSISNQFDSFKFGFLSVCGGNVLKLFRYEELELLICGSKEINFDELERATRYVEGYSQNQDYIKEFWKFVKSFSLEKKKKFLQFTTGSDRVPIRGLGNLELLILRHGGDTDKLPTTQTCFNYLLLPEYSSIEKMKKLLLKALEYSEGFHLQ
jgi:ubiquitin-protein ligase E3 A